MGIGFARIAVASRSTELMFLLLVLCCVVLVMMKKIVECVARYLLFYSFHFINILIKNVKLIQQRD